MTTQRTVESVNGLAEDVLAGSHRAIARAITLVENGQTDSGLHAALFPKTGNAFTIGITGPPGAGKSTLVDQLVAEYRTRGLSAGVLAVDPSSPFTRGALLGDRIRMRSYADDSGVFVRSMANRGHVGGLALATSSAVRVLDAAGFDRVLVETVGVGQSEVDIVDAVDCTVVVEVPGMGDVVQTMKAGLMEIADQFVVNKADRDGAGRIARELRRLLRGRDERPTSSTVVMTEAHAGRGIADLAASLEEFRDLQESTSMLVERRQNNLAHEVRAFVGEHARRRLLGGGARGDLPEQTLAALEARTHDPEELAVAIVDAGVQPTFESALEATP